MTTNIDTLKKAETIRKIVARCISSGYWQSACADEATAFLDRSERSRRSEVIAFVADEYKAAGRDSRGRVIAAD